MIKAINMYNDITSFDDTINKALGRLNKKNSKNFSKFGKPNKNYSFLREPTFDNIFLFLLKSEFCPMDDVQSLHSLHPLYDHMYISLSRSSSIDFTTLLHNDPEWESQKSIPFHKKMRLLTCSLYFDLNIPQMI